MAGFLPVSFYATMVAAGLIVEWVFDGLSLIPGERELVPRAGFRVRRIGRSR